MKKSYEIKTLRGNEICDSFLMFEDRGSSVTLDYRLEDRHLFVEDEYPFFALVKLRCELEKWGLLLLCQGARTDVYPSGMSSVGLMAYTLTIGLPGEKLVNIFDPLIDIQSVGTVKNQKEYRELWLKSLS